MSDCPARLNIAGKDFECDWPTDPDGTHLGWAHRSIEAEAVWCGNEGLSVRVDPA